MKFSDIVALARMGYKPDDIRELMKLKDETPTEPEKPAPEVVPEPVNEPEPQEAPEESQSDPQGAGAESDKIRELEEKVKGLQDANARRARPEPKPEQSDEEILNDLVRSFM